MANRIILKIQSPLSDKEKSFFENNNFSYGTSKSIYGGVGIINAVSISVSTILISELIKVIISAFKEKRLIKFEYKGFTINDISFNAIKKRIVEIDKILSEIEEEKRNDNNVYTK